MSIDLASATKLPPPIPDKMDIIPIHNSDRATFKQCRRKWQWSSPMQRNLRQRVDLHGINMALFFGTGIHYALEQYYHPVLRRDPVESFSYWFDLQWKGGLISEDDLRLTYDPHPKQHLSDAQSGLLWQVEGLNSLIPDPDEAEFMEHRELGINMMNFYKTYAEREDNFAVIAAEHDFSIPIKVLSRKESYIIDNSNFELGSGNLLWARDPRDGGFKPVHARGRMDLIIQDLETGQFWIRDFKTTAQLGEEYYLKLEKDPQCTSYLHAAEVEAELYDLPYKKMTGIWYDAIRKAYPRPPTVTKRAPFFSIDRNKESTTPELLRQYISDNGLEVVIADDEKIQEYIKYVEEVGDSQFIVRTPVRRNRHEIKAAGEQLFLEAVDMLNDPSIYPSPTGEWKCLRCPFRAPCIAADDGSDFEMLLTNNYEANRDR